MADGKEALFEALFHENKLSIVSSKLPVGGSRVPMIGHIIVLEEWDYIESPSNQEIHYELQFLLTKELLEYRGPSKVIDGHMILEMPREHGSVVLLPKRS